jgi:hypothetical protein
MTGVPTTAEAGLKQMDTILASLCGYLLVEQLPGMTSPAFRGRVTGADYLINDPENKKPPTKLSIDRQTAAGGFVIRTVNEHGMPVGYDFEVGLGDMSDPLGRADEVHQLMEDAMELTPSQVRLDPS